MNNKNQNQGGSMKAAAQQATSNKSEEQGKPAGDATPAVSQEELLLKLQQAEERAAKAEAANVEAAKKSGEQSDLAKSQEELLLRLQQVEAENQRLKDEAVDTATQISEMRKLQLKPTTAESGVYQVSLKSNPTAFVRADNPGEANRIYSDYYGILGSEHSFSCGPVDEAPEGATVIQVNEHGHVYTTKEDGQLVIAGG